MLPIPHGVFFINFVVYVLNSIGNVILLKSTLEDANSAFASDH